MTEDRLGKREVAVTMLVEEWFAVVAQMVDKPLSDEGRKVRTSAIQKLAKQLSKVVQDYTKEQT